MTGLRSKLPWLRGLLLVLGLALGAELIFLASLWPDWAAWRQGQIPESALIKAYKEQRESQVDLPPLRWNPVQKAFPKAIKNVFVLAEDSRFYEHHGIDLQALLDAIAYNVRHGKILLGASTISQQTAKNMFLSLSRSPLRKWHELLLTLLLEGQLSKAEILHIYLNVAEFGTGVFGLEAAAQLYYKSSARNLSQSQAIELAASLPSPKKHNPRQRSRHFQRRVQRIAQTMRVVDRYAAEPPQLGRHKAAAEELQKSLEELRREMNANPSEPVPVEDAPTDQAAPPLAVPEPPLLEPEPGEGEGDAPIEAVPEPEVQANPPAAPSEGSAPSEPPQPEPSTEELPP